MAFKINWDGQPVRPRVLVDSTGNFFGSEANPIITANQGGSGLPVSDINGGTQSITVAAKIPTAGPVAGRKGLRIFHVSGAGKLFVLARAVGDVNNPTSADHIVALEVGQGWEEPLFGEDVELVAVAEAGTMVVRFEELL